MNGWRYCRNYIREVDWKTIEGLRARGVEPSEVFRAGLTTVKRKQEPEERKKRRV